MAVAVKRPDSRISQHQNPNINSPSNESEYKEDKNGAELLSSIKDVKETPLFYRLQGTEKFLAAQQSSAKPRLSGSIGEFIDLDDSDDGEGAMENFSTKPKSFLTVAATRMKRAEKRNSNLRSNWKAEIERKMRIKREEEMRKRNECYQKEKEKFDENFGYTVSEEDDDVEIDTDLDSDDDNGGVEEEDSVKETNRKSVERENVAKNGEDKDDQVGTEFKSYDTQDLNLTLIEDTEHQNGEHSEEHDENDDDSIEINGSHIAPYQRPRPKSSNEEKNISNVSNPFIFPPEDTQELDKRNSMDLLRFTSTQESPDEIPSVGYRFNDYCNSSSTPKTNSIRKRTLNELIGAENEESFCTQDLLGLCSGQFATGPSTKADMMLETDKDEESCAVHNEAFEELGMEKNVSAQEAEDEILQLLTNPFHSKSQSSRLLNLPENSVSDSGDSPSNKNKSSRNNIIDEDALDGFASEEEDEKVESRRSSMRRVKLFVVDDDEEDEDKPILSGINPTKKSTKETSAECIADNDANDYVDNDEVENPDEADYGTLDGEKGESGESESEYDEDCDDVNEEDDEMAMFKKIESNKFRDQNGKLKKDFFEQEAELSGSDVGSGDEDEADNDEMESELGDLDQDLPEGEELRRQVGKIYHKQMLDDDKRELLLYQDKFLPDGDLQTENGGLRRLRWRQNGDEDVDLNSELLDKDNADEDDLELGGIDEARIMFFFDKPNSSQVPASVSNSDELSVPTFTASKLTIRRSTSAVTNSSTTLHSEPEKVDANIFTEKIPLISRQESFLARSKVALKKIVKENGDSNSTASINTAKSLFITHKSPEVIGKSSNNSFSLKRKSLEFSSSSALKSEKRRITISSETANSSVFSFLD